MIPRSARLLIGAVVLLSTVAFSAVTPVTAQDNPPPQPIELPCATNALAQVLGGTPVNDGAQTLVLARVIFQPGGSIGAHTHPGTLVATVESGSLGFTHLGDGEMSVIRAATVDGEAVTEPLPHGEEVVFSPGDTFIETGMVHTATSLSDGPTTVLLTGLIEAGQSLTICVDQATPAMAAPVAARQ